MNEWTIIEDNKVHLLKPGTLVRGETMTYAQKWLSDYFYREYNCTVYGIITSHNNKSMTDIMVRKLKVIYSNDSYDDYDMLSDDDDDVRYLVVDPGTSGMSFVYAYNGNDMNHMINELAQSEVK